MRLNLEDMEEPYSGSKYEVVFWRHLFITTNEFTKSISILDSYKTQHTPSNYHHGSDNTQLAVAIVDMYVTQMAAHPDDFKSIL